jgi:hypothetical protein
MPGDGHSARDGGVLAVERLRRRGGERDAEEDPAKLTA